VSCDRVFSLYFWFVFSSCVLGTWSEGGVCLVIVCLVCIFGGCLVRVFKVPGVKEVCVL